MVVHMLGTAIRKSNRVRSRDSSCTISSLLSIESSVGVVISNSISIGVRGRLIRVSWLSSVISRGNLDNWGSMHNWSSMVGRGSMSNSNRLVSTDSRLDLSKALRVIYLRHGGMGGSESLGLDNASLFTIRSGH